MPESIRNITAAIEYIEGHLHEKLDLETVAGAVHYSKYHLHRMFTGAAGLTLHDYIQRRRLTEAAEMLVSSDKPILEIALSAGYESQQAFTDIFRAMYKKSPKQYRREKDFYPLQLKYVLNDSVLNPEEGGWKENIVFAENEDIPAWMGLVHLVVDGFPHLDEGQYLEGLREYIKNRRALILKDAAGAAVGAMAFNEVTGSIDFLGVHPQYGKREITGAFCEKAFELVHPPAITVTTFRENDRADTGYRAVFKSLGFTEGELLTEFGYPTQRLIMCREETRETGHE